MQELNSEPVIPEGFPEWKETMDLWGSKMIAAIEVLHFRHLLWLLFLPPLQQLALVSDYILIFTCTRLLLRWLQLDLVWTRTHSLL